MSTHTWQKRFKRTRKLADTLQGHIYLAEDLQKNKIKVVVKETYKTLVDTGKSRDGHVVHEDFHKETQILTYLSKQPDADEGFCRIILEWETDDCFYYAMQFCEAELFKFISNSFAANGLMYNFMKKENSKPQIPCDKNDAHKWLAQIRSVFRQCVQCCYWMQVKGICHLDLSLENTMIFSVDGLKVKIIDFGLAKHYDYKNNEKHANFLNDQRVGKRGYMAPEVYNKMIYDARKADIWSLGVMLFMMLVGAPPYKRATQRDAAFNYIINGMLEDVLKHWRRLRLVSKDALDCMERIFKWEKDRINMEQLIQHPFVDLGSLLHDKSGKQDPKNAYLRIGNAVLEYHNKYALPMQSQYNKDGTGGSSDHKSSDQNDESEADSPLLIKFTTDAIGKTDKLVLPSFVTACKEILSYGNIKLLDDFNHILTHHNKKNNINVKRILSCKIEASQKKSSESKPQPKANVDDDDNDNEEKNDELEEEKGGNLSVLYESLLDKIKNKAFLNIDNSIIIRRCYRNRKKCEDEKSLLDVYGKYNKNVINDDGHRMAMQIMDKIYFYFAYTYNFGYAFTPDEIKQLTYVEKEKEIDNENENESEDNDESEEKDDSANIDRDTILFKVKQLLKRKKQEILKTKHGKQLYNVMRDRKTKYVTDTRNCFADEKSNHKTEQKVKEEKPTPGPAIQIFSGIKHRMAQYLKQMKSASKTMSHREFVKFLKTLQIRSKKEPRFSKSLKGITSDQWKTLINKFDSLQMSQAYFNGMSKKQFGNCLKKILATGYIVKVYKVISEELIQMQEAKFFTTKERMQECDNREIILLLLAVLRETDKVDIENDLNEDIIKKLLQNINGLDFIGFDEEYIINNIICESLYDKFAYINSHRFGKRFRYWPAYSDNKTCDLLNGFYTHHWYVRPKFNDIKDEILNNAICCITVNQWNRTVLYASKVIIRTVALKQLKAKVESNKKDGGSTANSSYNKYGVKNGDRIRLEHLVPILIYINLDFVSKALIETYNNNNSINSEYAQCIKYMKNHAQLSHLARLVRETVECYGQVSPANKTITFYHLVDKSIPVSSLHTRFFSPTSVTTSLNTAFILNDFNDSQIIFEINASPQLKYFNCSFLSDFPNENEALICGGLATLQTINMYDLCLANNYIYYINAINILLNTINNCKPHSENQFDDNTYAKIGQSLNSLMQERFKYIKSKSDADSNDNYINNTFNKICDNICYAQININYVLNSPLMKAVFYNPKNKSIRFDVLCSMFPNIQRYFVTLNETYIENVNDIIFNDNMMQFMVKNAVQIKGIKFSFGVDNKKKIESLEQFKNYKEKFVKNGYELNCFTQNNENGTILSIDESQNKHQRNKSTNI